MISRPLLQIYQQVVDEWLQRNDVRGQKLEIAILRMQQPYLSITEMARIFNLTPEELEEKVNLANRQIWHTTRKLGLWRPLVRLLLKDGALVMNAISGQVLEKRADISAFARDLPMLGLHALSPHARGQVVVDKLLNQKDYARFCVGALYRRGLP